MAAGGIQTGDHAVVILISHAVAIWIRARCQQRLELLPTLKVMWTAMMSINCQGIRRHFARRW